MGKEIEALALERNHRVVGKIDIGNPEMLGKLQSLSPDVAIEFTTPSTAFGNVIHCLEQGVPVVSGTTGWADRLEEARELCMKTGGAFFHASNFSIGVNILFHLNRELARIMEDFHSYNPSVDETHHTRKLDAPSGTALVLAGDILQALQRKTGWSLDKTGSDSELLVRAFREDDVPGIHTVRYESANDSLELVHSAKSRKGFAEGAVMAAEFLAGKKGVFGMNDLLKLEKSGKT